MKYPKSGFNAYRVCIAVCVILSIIALLCFLGVRNRYSEEEN